MATPVQLDTVAGVLVITIATPGGQRLPLADALGQFQCKASERAGVRLAEVVLTAFARVTEEKRSSLTPGRSMPLLMLKDQLFRLVPVCTTCRGNGCPTCKGTGFP